MCLPCGPQLCMRRCRMQARILAQRTPLAMARKSSSLPLSPAYGAAERDETNTTSHEAGIPTWLWWTPAQVAPQLQVIAVADAPLEVLHASAAWHKLEPLLPAGACQLLRLHAPEVRSYLVLLLQRNNMHILMTGSLYHAVLQL